MTTDDIDAIRKVDPSNSTGTAVGSPSSDSNERCTDIAAIRKQIPAVYDGPWYVQFREDDGRWLVGYPTDNPKAGLIATVPDYGEQLAEFIAAARTLVPALCDEIEHLRASVKQLIEFRNVKVWEADELAKRLATVRSLVERADRADSAWVSGGELQAALGERHPAESRPAVVLDGAEAAR